MDQPDDPPTSPDHLPNDPPDARWMSFAELARERGISKLSAAALVRRHCWRRQRDNRGRALALVPRDGPELRRAEADHKADNPPDDRAYTAAFTAAQAAKDETIAALPAVIAARKAS